MRNELNVKSIQGIRAGETSRRKFINTILNPLKQLSTIVTSSDKLTLQETNGIQLSSMEQAKNIEHEHIIKVLENNLRYNQGTIASLRVTLEEKETQEHELANKITGIWKICDIFTKHFNQLCDNYKDIENTRDNLSQMFNNIHFVQGSKIKQHYEKLEQYMKANAEQKELLADVQGKHTSQEQQIKDLLTRITELESKLISEQNVMDTFVAEKSRFLQDYERLKTEKEQLWESFQQTKTEQENALKLLTQMKGLEDELRASRIQIEELTCCNAEYLTKNEILMEDNKGLMQQLEHFTTVEKGRLSTVIDERDKLLVEANKWKQKNEEAKKEYLKLEKSVCDMRNKYQDLEYRYKGLEKLAGKKELELHDIIKKLSREIESMLEKQVQQHANNNKKLVKPLDEKQKQEEKITSGEKYSISNTNFKLVQTKNEKAYLQKEIQEIKTVNSRLEQELKRTNSKLTIQQTAKHISQNNDNENLVGSVVAKNIGKDCKLMELNKNVKTSTDTGIPKEIFNKSLLLSQSNPVLQVDVYDLNVCSTETLARYKSICKPKGMNTSSQPVRKSVFTMPNSPKPHSIMTEDRNTLGHKRFFVSDRSCIDEVSKLRRRT